MGITIFDSMPDSWASYAFEKCAFDLQAKKARRKEKLRRNDEVEEIKDEELMKSL